MAAAVGLVIFVAALFHLSSIRKAETGLNNAKNTTNATSLKTPLVPKPKAPTILVQNFITKEKLMAHLENLNDIGIREKSRAIGTPGYMRSVEYVVSQLQVMQPSRLNWKIQNFTIAVNELDHDAQQPKLSPSNQAAQTWTYGADFIELANSGFGNLTARVVAVQDYGCNESHYSAVREEVDRQRGPVLALVKRGTCLFHDKMALARAAGAAAVAISNKDDTIFRGTLGSFPDIQVGLRRFLVTFDKT